MDKRRLKEYCYKKSINELFILDLFVFAELIIPLFTNKMYFSI